MAKFEIKWEIGKYINSVILDFKRAPYGKKIFSTLSRKLAAYFRRFRNHGLPMSFNVAFPGCLYLDDFYVIVSRTRRLLYGNNGYGKTCP
jgi:hypothetical protein